LVIEFRDSSPARAEELVEQISEAYLDVRRQFLLQRRSQVLADLRNRFNELAVIGVATPGAQNGSRGSVGAELSSVDQAISNIVLTP
ncbi:hypothetical protein U2073_15345, partial [Listeria monocytogenes]|uniref:hypothetical protein n=1 Tax=Listeria monocytogenes TaxID=1639 RepID=UPI002FDBCF2C